MGVVGETAPCHGILGYSRGPSHLEQAFSMISSKISKTKQCSRRTRFDKDKLKTRKEAVDFMVWQKSTPLGVCRPEGVAYQSIWNNEDYTLRPDQ